MRPLNNNFPFPFPVGEFFFDYNVSEPENCGAGPSGDNMHVPPSAGSSTTRTGRSRALLEIGQNLVRFNVPDTNQT